MSEFDGSTGGAAATDYAPHGDNGVAPAEAMRFGPAVDDAPTSALDMLRERVEQREVAETEPWVHEVKAIGVRLVCDTNIDNADYQRWMKASMPKTRGARRARAAGALDLDQLALSARAIAATNMRVELRSRDGKTWTPITDSQTGAVLTCDETGMLRAFNVMDSVSLLRKLFGRDADLINAGQDLLTAAGYLENDGDDEDPT